MMVVNTAHIQKGDLPRILKKLKSAKLPSPDGTPVELHEWIGTGTELADKVITEC